MTVRSSEKKVNKLDKPVFIISLDIELAWGFISNPKHKILSLLKRDTGQIREAISSLLKLFERHDIPATWAIVGHLFFNPKEAKELIHQGTDQFALSFNNDIESNTLYHGEDIVEKILSSSVDHEIGWHSFSHPDFTEISREMASNEIKAVRKIEEKWGIRVKSFVFPQNRIAHVDVLKENDFRTYRGRNGFHNDKCKGVKKYIQLGLNEILPLPVTPVLRGSVLEIPTSMEFFDPMLPFTVLSRAKFGLSMAIHSKKVFHIFLHPWSLLVRDQLGNDLDKFMKHVNMKREEGSLQVMTMGDLADYINKRDTNN